MAHGGPDYSISTIADFMSGNAQPQFNAYNRDAVTWNIGTVVIWDNLTVQGIKTTTSFKDMRVCGVVAANGILPGELAPVYYHGVAQVNVIGAGSAGDALVTSATAGSAVAGVGGARQYGFLGFALESWAGPGLILAFIDPDNFRYNASVKIEGVLIINAAGVAAGNLQCGVNPNQAVVAFYMGSSQGGGAAAPATNPTVNGIQMAAQLAYAIGFGAETGQWSGLFTILAPPTGLVGVTAPIVVGGALPMVTCIFVAVSGYGSFGTAVRNQLNTGVAVVSCTDAIPGDLALGFAIYDSALVFANPLVTARGAGQTTLGYFQNAVRTFVMMEGDSKNATIAAETFNFTLTAAFAWCAACIPIRPI